MSQSMADKVSFGGHTSMRYHYAPVSYSDGQEMCFIKIQQFLFKHYLEIL